MFLKKKRHYAHDYLIMVGIHRLRTTHRNHLPTPATCVRPQFCSLPDPPALLCPSTAHLIPVAIVCRRIQGLSEVLDDPRHAWEHSGTELRVQEGPSRLIVCVTGKGIRAVRHVRHRQGDTTKARGKHRYRDLEEVRCTEMQHAMIRVNRGVAKYGPWHQCHGPLLLVYSRPQQLHLKRPKAGLFGCTLVVNRFSILQNGDPPVPEVLIR